MSVFSDYLRIARLRAGISQQEAIDRVMGTKGHRAIWCHWERGDYKPMPHRVGVIAQAVGLTFEDLMSVYDSVSEVV